MKKRNVMKLQRFAASAYDGNAYCDFNAAAAKAIEMVMEAVREAPRQ